MYVVFSANWDCKPTVTRKGDNKRSMEGIYGESN